MAYALTVPEMVQALGKIEPERAAEFEKLYCGLGDAMARLIAEKLEVKTGGACSFIDDATQAAFLPSYVGQSLPNALSGFDEIREWRDSQAEIPGIATAPESPVTQECWITLRFKGEIATNADSLKIANDLLKHLELCTSIAATGFSYVQKGDVFHIEEEAEIYDNE